MTAFTFYNVAKVLIDHPTINKPGYAQGGDYKSAGRRPLILKILPLMCQHLLYRCYLTGLHADM